MPETRKGLRRIAVRNSPIHGHGVSGDPAGCPSRLKVEATGNTVNVEQFACEIEMRSDSAFHGLEIDLAKIDSATSNKLILIERFAIHFKLTVPKQPAQGVCLFAREVRPSCFRLRSANERNLFP